MFQTHSKSKTYKTVYRNNGFINLNNCPAFYNFKTLKVTKNILSINLNVVFSPQVIGKNICCKYKHGNPVKTQQQYAKDRFSIWKKI